MKNKSEFWTGTKDSLPIMFAVTFFAMLFGATGVNNGLSFGETLLSSATVFAGASQFVFLDLYGKQVPVWSILLAVFAINFRHVLYSASLGRYMGDFSASQKYSAFFLLCDPLFGAGEIRAQDKSLTPSYYFGYGIPLYFIWIGFTSIGALFGKLITNPQALGFDMLLSIYFLSLLMGFRSRPNWLATVLASGVASVLIFKTLGAPWHIMLGSLVGVTLAAIIGKPDVEEGKDV